MTRILVRFYNTVMKKGCYLKRWVKLLAVILEKGKGPIIGKLRTIQLIEADLQLLMRIFIGMRAEFNLENDNRMLKFNYGSRSHYSIENAILEKRLMCDLAQRDSQIMMHNMSDLEACYDRQLANIGCLVEESVGLEREPALLFTKILPVMEHHTCTSYGISDSSCGSKHFKLGGTGQGNSVSGSICRDTSCIIFKHLEDKKLGIDIQHPISQKDFVRLAIAFVDDTDFCTNGSMFMEKMQRIIDEHTRLYEATGGKMQQSKILFYCWRWTHKNGVKEIEQITAELEVHGEQIKQLDIIDSTRTLGVHVTPTLSWITQFEVMRKKLSTSITKLMRTNINSYQAAIYYNAYMIKSVCFGCGIIELSEEQEIELKKIYEEPLLIKLGLSRRFPRAVLHSRKSALGIGIMTPRTIIDILKAKLHVGNVRREGETNAAIALHEELLVVEAGRNVAIGSHDEHRH